MLMPHNRSLLAALHDAIATIIAWYFAYLLRFNFTPPAEFSSEMWRTLVGIVPLQTLIFWRFGLYRGIWRYASIPDLRRILIAVLMGTASIPLLFWMLRLEVVVPRSVLVLYPILLLLIMGGSRLVYRLWKERALYASMDLRGEPVIVLGAGDAAVSLSKELARSHDWKLVGFLDDDTNKQGSTLNGIKVLGKLEELPHWAQRFGISQAIIAMPSAAHQVRKHAIEIANQCGIKVLTVPSFDDLLSGKVSVSQLRAVELDDLLGRDPIQLDAARVA